MSYSFSLPGKVIDSSNDVFFYHNKQKIIDQSFTSIIKKRSYTLLTIIVIWNKCAHTHDKKYEWHNHVVYEQKLLTVYKLHLTMLCTVFQLIRCKNLFIQGNNTLRIWLDGKGKSCLQTRQIPAHVRQKYYEIKIGFNFLEQWTEK